MKHEFVTCLKEVTLYFVLLWTSSQDALKLVFVLCIFHPFSTTRTNSLVGALKRLEVRVPQG